LLSPLTTAANSSDWSEMSHVGGETYAVWGSSSSDVFATGYKGIILHYDGSSWSKMSSAASIDYLYGIWGSSSSDVFAVGEGGTILHYDGSTWSSMTSGTTGLLIGIWGSSSSDVFAVGPYGIILHCTDVTETNGDTPTVTSVIPDQADPGATLDVTITGIYFNNAIAVELGYKITVNSITVDSDTQITASITIASDAPTGTRNVLVVTLEGTEYLYSPRLLDSFLVGASPSIPSIASISPDRGNLGQTLNVTITGTNFTGASTVRLGTGVNVNSYTVNSDTQITASITIASSAPTGIRGVSVTTPTGTDTQPMSFNLLTTSPPYTPPYTPPSFWSRNWGTIVGAIIGSCIVTVSVAWVIVSKRRGLLIPQPTIQQPIGSFCHECGERLEGPGRFCQNCGTEQLAE